MDDTPIPSALAPNRCIGALCPKHPQLGGLRRKRNRECIQCRQEYRQKWKARPEQRDIQSTKYKEQREMGKVAALLAVRKMDAIRIRATQLASSKVQNVSRWQEFYNEAREQIEAETK